MEPPVRLCCMTRHTGPYCPDGKVMCCICFRRFPPAELAVINGERMDICEICAQRGQRTTDEGRSA